MDTILITVFFFTFGYLAIDYAIQEYNQHQIKKLRKELEERRNQWQS